MFTVATTEIKRQVATKVAKCRTVTNGRKSFFVHNNGLCRINGAGMMIIAETREERTERITREKYFYDLSV